MATWNEYFEETKHGVPTGRRIKVLCELDRSMMVKLANKAALNKSKKSHVGPVSLKVYRIE